MRSLRSDDTPLLPDLYGMDREALAGVLAPLGAKPFHAGQVYRWLYARRQFDPMRWTDLPRAMREKLAASYRAVPGEIAARTEVPDGTVKYRVALDGGASVETVYMVQRGRVTLCISSQVGCALGCDFCLTGKMGLVRNLTAGEIAGQVALAQNDRALEDLSFNVVFMGMGEPLHNYDAVLAAVRLLTDPDGFGLSRQRITVSTSGLVPGIERLSREKLRPHLAVSLNATTDTVRDRIMPINRAVPLAKLLRACRDYAKATGEGFTFEYVLLSGVNDTDDDARRLERLARGLPVKINLIPFNPVPGWLSYTAPPRGRVVEIRDRLLADGVQVSIRWSRGAEARAACGQLALLPDRPAGEAPAAQARRSRVRRTP